MNHTEIAAKTAAYLETFVGKEGFRLLKTEYVKEDGIFYLRAYIDLTDGERENRRKKLEEERAEQKAEQEAEQEGKDGPDGTAEEASGKAGQDTAGESGGNGEGTDETPPEPGIGINDCAFVSRRLSKWLDKEDFIPEEYMLEVCSKGYLN